MTTQTETTSAAAPLVTIQDVAALQIVSADAPPQPLAQGKLELYPGDEGGEADSKPILLLTVGNKAFPLLKDTIFGTHAGVEEWYTFDLALPTAASASAATDEPSRTWVRLNLPPQIRQEGSEANRARDHFEEVLINKGLLLDGIKATGDEWGQAAAQTGAAAASRLSAHSASIRSDSSFGAAPPQLQNGGDIDSATFSRQSHRWARGTRQTTNTLASYSTAASEAVSSFASSAGSALGSAYRSATQSLGTDDASSHEKSHGRGDAASDDKDDRYLADTRDAISQAASGAAQGVGEVYSTGTTEAPRVITHTHGSDAADLATEVGKSAQNVGQVAADVTLGTSTVVHGYHAAKGAAQDQ